MNKICIWIILIALQKTVYTDTIIASCDQFDLNKKLSKEQEELSQTEIEIEIYERKINLLKE